MSHKVILKPYYLITTLTYVLMDNFCPCYRSANSSVTKIEIEGVPPIAIEALMEYCYKDR